MKGSPQATKHVGLKIGLGAVALVAAGVFLYLQLAGGTQPGMPEPGSGASASSGGPAKPAGVPTVKDGSKPQSGQGAQSPSEPPKPNPGNGGNRIIPKEQAGGGGGGG